MAAETKTRGGGQGVRFQTQLICYHFKGEMAHDLCFRMACDEKNPH